jgi:hypothetical protein
MMVANNHERITWLNRYGCERSWTNLIAAATNGVSGTGMPATTRLGSGAPIAVASVCVFDKGMGVTPGLMTRQAYLLASACPRFGR